MLFKFDRSPETQRRTRHQDKPGYLTLSLGNPQTQKVFLCEIRKQNKGKAEAPWVWCLPPPHPGRSMGHRASGCSQHEFRFSATLPGYTARATCWCFKGIFEE